MKRSSPTLALLLSVAVALGLVLGACGVATKSSADRAKAADVPFGLLDTDPPSGASASPAGTPVEIYYYDSANQRLVRTEARLDDPSLENALRQLQDATAAGAETLPSGNPLGDADVIQSVSVSGGVATVDLAESFTELSTANQLAALAEIVYTATARPGVGQVTFTLDGQPREVPRGDGSLSSSPLTRRDYQNVAPIAT